MHVSDVARLFSEFRGFWHHKLMLEHGQDFLALTNRLEASGYGLSNAMFEIFRYCSFLQREYGMLGDEVAQITADIDQRIAEHLDDILAERSPIRYSGIVFDNDVYMPKERTLAEKWTFYLLAAASASDGERAYYKVNIFTAWRRFHGNQEHENVL